MLNNRLTDSIPLLSCQPFVPCAPMIYLTKTADGKTCHFRVSVDNHLVDIVEGIFYNSLNQYAEALGDHDAAIARQQELVQEKLQEGYTETGYVESLENTVSVYDKAKWHFEGDFPGELDDYQGYVHTGMFVGWLIENDLMSEEFRNDLAAEIARFRKKELTGVEIFQRCCDGVLLLEDISEAGNRFTLPYFNFETGQYLADYEMTLAQNLPTIYHVPDTWDNYDKLKQVLDQRYAGWKRSNT